MRCANCGKEFGNGTNCQSCGTDRVSGLANYSGYIGQDDNGYDSSDYGEQTSPRTTVCYACSEIIPVGSTFCPACGKQLLVECPNCGHEYSSQYPVCSKCGTNRNLYFQEKKKRERRRTEKAIEIQREENIKSRAQQLRNDYSSTLLYFIIFIILAGGLFFLFFSYFEHFNFFLLVIFILMLGVGCPWLASEINELITNSKIDKWKQEHPSDPRSQYL